MYISYTLVTEQGPVYKQLYKCIIKTYKVFITITIIKQ